MDTRSGEILSACIGLILGVTALLNPESLIFKILSKADAFPEWAIMSVLSSVTCLVCVFLKSPQSDRLARFLSGCVYGTIVMLTASIEYFGAFFWVAALLFAFDIVIVTLNGRSAWMQRNRS